VFEIAVPKPLDDLVAEPRVALVLGSGFGGLAEAVENVRQVPYAEIEGFPRPAAGIAGHAGTLMLGEVSGVSVVVFSGRVHRYQGVSALDAAYPARLASALGCDTLVVTNAAGGVNPELRVGDVVLLSDQMNLTGDSPLVGWPGPPGGVPFVPMRDAYDPQLRALAREVAAEKNVELVDGVYAGLLGPAFETPAEVRYLRTVGADVVGMSTVPEVIAARALGLRVLGFSLVTNAAAGEGLSHEEVLEAGQRAQEALSGLLAAILLRLSSE
jgi:purine-nucleoside phosphorylase